MKMISYMDYMKVEKRNMNENGRMVNQMVKESI